MSAACNCISGAVNTLKAAAPLRSARQWAPSTRRTLTSSSSQSASLRTHLRNQGLYNGTKAEGRNACLKSVDGQQQLRRPFSSSGSQWKLNTIEQIKARNRSGPFNLTAAVLFVVAGAGLWQYFKHEKERMERKRIAEQTKGVGKPKVGGPFDLVDHHGHQFTHEDLNGKYALVYFGFTHCPDICPDELDKMADMIDKVKKQCGNVILPIMITCDPARDTPAVLQEYLKEFHPDIIGLTGTYDNIKAACKAYRVYFSTPPTVKPGQDYLVDHSIYFYLMDPEGDFVEAIGRNFTADQAAKVISDHIKDWKGPLSKKDYWA